jgi:Domain of unknown function (DUF4041)/T5orf172 domain
MLTTILLLSFLLIAAVIVIVLLFLRLRKLNSEQRALSAEHAALKERVKDVVDIDTEKQLVLAEIETIKQRESREIEAKRQQELGNLEADRTRLQAEITHLANERTQAIQNLQEQRRLSETEIEAIRLRARDAQNQANSAFQEQQRRGAMELESLQLNINRLREELKPLDEEAYLQSFGFYKPRYNFTSSDQYQRALDNIRENQKRMIKDKSAAICRVEWTVSGSRTEGRKATNQTLRLILRAFNGECDAAIAKVKYNNIHVMESRIRKAWEAINGLVGVQQCEIAPTYLDLKLKELYLVHEYQEKLQDEKEEQRRIREEMREEEIARRELEKAQIDAEREETRYAEALRKAQVEAERAVGEKQQKLLEKIEELQRRLEEAHTNKERATARAQMTRSGYVYIISNIGSFGEHVYKIGMTRRLDPMDRVRELGDASVPFQFDVHAIIYSEDAPGLENALHRKFNNRRVNRVNERKEFFNVTIEEIAEVVRQQHGEIAITLAAEAVDYRKTLALIKALNTNLTEQVSQPAVQV